MPYSIYLIICFLSLYSTNYRHTKEAKTLGDNVMISYFSWIFRKRKKKTIYVHILNNKSVFKKGILENILTKYQHTCMLS